MREAGPASDAQALRLRRERMQARLRRREEARQFRTLAPALRAAGVRRLSRLPPARAGALVEPLQHLPGRDERFWWPDIPGGRCVGWDTDAQRDAAFFRALEDCFAPGARLAFVFHTVESALVLGREDALRHAGLLLAELKETLWVIPLRDAQALVEVSFIDRQVCWLERIPAPG